MTHPRKKKLIEVGLPLETINKESAREKSIRHGHPSTLHLWWARRPLATARAVLFAQLVDDPSAHPEEFPTEAAQDAERKRLHELIEAMVVWENTAPDAQGIPLPRLGRTVSGRELFAMARDEIAKSNGGTLPAILDPFAGGGTIPLEAQRLGLEAHASDLNPVAVLINKALIEIPPKFADRPPVHPGAPERIGGWPRATGLAEDVRYYGQWMRDEAFKRIGHLYPKVRDDNGVERTVIAWIWARTVRSPNPANPIEVPLVRSWWLGKKKGKEAWVKASVVDGQAQYEVMHNPDGPTSDMDGTRTRQGGVSIADGTPISSDWIKAEGTAGRMGAHMIAVVAEGSRERLYLSPSSNQTNAADVSRPDDVPNQELPYDPRNVWTPPYGLTRFSDLFTNRQLMAMTTFSDLVAEAREQVLAAALAAGLPEGPRLEDSGADAAAYADAVAVYLGLGMSRTTDLNNSLATWSNSRDQTRNLFARQAIPMAWDFVEVNPFAGASGDLGVALSTTAEALDRLPAWPSGHVNQANAAAVTLSALNLSTDPPYYDNVGYSDLSDFFYMWQERALGTVLPGVFSTVLTPKADELVANPYRHDGREGAERFFVDGFNAVFAHIREAYDGPVDKLLTVYYAYKQQDSDDDGTASTGWHTLLDGLVKTGWEVTSTWPVRSERRGRMLSVGTNALASSIVLACRPRPEDAPVTTRRSLLASLKQELPNELRTMMQGAVAPVDLAQAAIGPGMSIFSRYSRVREPDGSDMSVRDALSLINETLDQVMDEQESDFDPETRFAVKWYRTYGWSTESSGTADTLARATGTSPIALERGGIFGAKGGKANLLSPTVLEGDWDPEADAHVSVWEATVRLAAIMAKDGAEKVATLLPAVASKVSLDAVKELGFLLFHEAEKKRDTQDAILFNGLVSAWGDLASQARRIAADASRPKARQDTLDFDGRAE
ncbi:MAG: DUF1156 domain-containing protein [Propionibacteriaceae bacterium]|jgi:putative DNA methylase|nr:DUF1156 domain-containing protein [Propionibacteriaceae bacterium]